MNTTKIIKEISKENFEKIVEQYSAKIKVSPHAFDHLNQAQRSIYKDKTLEKTLLEEKPKGVGLQKNGRYAAFYRRKEGFTKLICEIKRGRLEIITFINVETMPNLKRIK